MREILFRGKRIDNGEWVEGTLYQIAQKLNPFIMLVNRSGESHAVNPETVGQYTGLEDKNGRRIFEGDILRLWRSIGANGEMRGEYGKPLPVEYCDLWCQFVVVDEEIKEQYCIYQAFQAFEVIGNRWDNPELLKGGASE